MITLYFVLFVAAIAGATAHPIEESKVKRQVLGGESLQDPNDPIYKKLAQESFEKYRTTNPGEQITPKKLKVTRVTTQVVAGTMTRLDFTVTPANDEDITCHSEIWEQPWLKKKEINVDCSLNKSQSKVKRQITGGLMEQDPNNEEYKKLAQESLEKFSETNPGGPIKAKQIKVTKVTSQVVSGFMIRLTFTVVPANGEEFTCHSNVWERAETKDIDVTCDLKRCSQRSDATRGVAFKGLTRINGRDRTKQPTTINIFHCRLKVVRNSKIMSPLYYVLFATFLAKVALSSELSRVKRQVPGGLTLQDPTDPTYKQLAQESFEKYCTTNPGGQVDVEDLNVTRVTRQVVAGYKTVIDFTVTPTNGEVITCHSEIFEQAWLKKKDIKVECVNKQMPATLRRIYWPRTISNVRLWQMTEQKPIGQEILERKWRWIGHQSKMNLPGGQAEKDPCDPKYMQLAQESFTKYCETNPGGPIDVKEIKVTKVTQQVVAGSMTRITFTVEPTDGEIFTCYAKIWEQPWLNKKEIEVKCEPDDYCYHWGQKQFIDIFVMTPMYLVLVIIVLASVDANLFEASSAIKQKSRVKRQKLGAPEIQDPTDPKYHKLAQESFEKYRETHSAGQIIVKDIIVTKATRQLVAGDMYRLSFTVFPNYGDEINCYSEVYEKLDHQKEFTVNCDNVKKQSRMKRDNLRRKNPWAVYPWKTGHFVNPNSTANKKLAEESFAKYLTIHPESQSLATEMNRIIVTKVHYLPAENKDTIDFVVFFNTAYPKSCHSEVRQHYWDLTKDITLNCSNLLTIVYPPE
ncbi:uncharacterized protein LOC134748514 [Cydia strobilella]|uniref:uncharacterized protein LOC134748514 n=1 Tax=Cydia strobilella TaxID=1100964 RepID=UPI00300769D3